MSSILRRWLPLAVWIALIFAASSIPGVKTEGIRLPRGFDKLVHFVEYAVLALLLYRGLAHGQRRARLGHALIVVAAGFAVAVADELYQSTIPGRDSSPADLAADAAGIVCGTLAAVWRRRRRAGRAQRR